MELRTGAQSGNYILTGNENITDSANETKINTEDVKHTLTGCRIDYSRARDGLSMLIMLPPKLFPDGFLKIFKRDCLYFLYRK